MEKKPGWNFEDIHNSKRTLESCRQSFIESSLKTEDKKLVQEYIDERTARKRLSPSRQSRLYYVFRAVLPLSKKPIRTMTLEDALKLSDQIRNMKITRYRKEKDKILSRNVPYKTDKNISDSTAQTYLITFQGFFLWLKRKKILAWDMDDFKAEVEIPKIKPKKLTETDKITWNEAVMLSKAARTLRDSAFIQVLWDSGARSQELLTLRVQDVKPVHEGKAAYLHIWQSKNEGSIRDILVVQSAPLLLEYLEKHPMKDNKDAPLWLDNDHRKLWRYDSMRIMLFRTAKYIGFSKPVNPHHFRKSEASERDELSDAQAKARHGWTQGSRMLNIYRHPDAKKGDKVLLAQSGIIEREAEVKKRLLDPQVCHVCGKVNPAGRERCSQCRSELGLTLAKVQADEYKTRLTLDALEEYSQDKPDFLKDIAAIIEKKMRGQNPA